MIRLETSDHRRVVVDCDARRRLGGVPEQGLELPRSSRQRWVALRSIAAASNRLALERGRRSP